MKRLKVKIYGKVQGVCFRIFIEKKANKIGLTGWVKNMPDGTVVAIFEGEADKLNKILEFCRTGPELARVEKIVEVFSKATGEFREFKIKY